MGSFRDKQPKPDVDKLVLLGDWTLNLDTAHFLHYYVNLGTLSSCFPFFPYSPVPLASIEIVLSTEVIGASVPQLNTIDPPSTWTCSALHPSQRMIRTFLVGTVPRREAECEQGAGAPAPGNRHRYARLRICYCSYVLVIQCWHSAPWLWVLARVSR